MTTLTYPDAFRIDVPSHWQSIETPDALVAAIDPTGTVFQSNVTVAAEPFPVTMSLQQIAASVIGDRNERLTQHIAESPIAADGSLRWSASFVVEFKGKPLVLMQWTMLVDQPTTASHRLVTVATLTILSTDTDSIDASEILDSLAMV